MPQACRVGYIGSRQRKRRGVRQRRESAIRNPQSAIRNPHYLYVAYTLSLTLKAANAVQTFNTARCLRELAREAGAEVMVVVPRWLREPSRFGEEFGAGVVHLSRIPFNKLTRFWKTGLLSYVERSAWSLLLIAWIVGRRVTGRGFAAIYVRDVVCAYWLARARALTGAPLVYEVHDLESSNPSAARGALWSRLRRSLDRVTIRRPARLVSLTSTFCDFLAERGLRDRAEVDVIPDAYDEGLYTGTTKAAARAALGLPADAFIVGYAGLTFAYRRLDLLVEAFAALPARLGPSRPLCLVLAGGRPAELSVVSGQWSVVSSQWPVGGGRWSAEILRCAQNDSGSALVLPGQVGQEEVVLYLYAADVLVIPDTVTTLTASPLKLFEYMAAGRAIVLRELPALREILGDDGLYFPPGDAAALADALERLARDPELAERLGAAAAARAAGYTYRERARRVLAALALATEF
ncbi:MAG: glycosyltransferase [Chloroflexia bacterium]